MDSNVLVTACCITYNQRDYIRQCLDGMVNQKTDFKYEIIVHDDASTDGTQEIVREYADRYPDLITPILQSENQYSKGTGAIASAILAATHGKYIVQCEGDDYWCDPNKLQLQVEVLEAHPECSQCVHATDTVDTQGKPQSMHFPEMELKQSALSTEDFMRYVLGEGYWAFHVSSLMVSTDLYREYSDFKLNGYPSRFYRVGDLPRFLYFALKGDTYYIDRVMSVYRIGSGYFMTRTKDDLEFAVRANQGFIDGLSAFDEYTDYRFHEYVNKALLSRQFEIDRIHRRFDLIVKRPEYRPLLRKKGILKAFAFTVIGRIMLIFGNRDE